MLKQFSVLRVILSFIIPYIILYAFYIQLNGEISPGGGFQAGVIFASGVICYDLIYGAKKMTSVFSIEAMTVAGVIGVLIYAITGTFSLIFDDNYLDYNSIARDKIAGQHIGIFCVEIGVGLTVASIMCLIYSLFQVKTE